MELSNSISTLFKLPASGQALQLRGFQAFGQSNERPGFQRATFHGARPHADRGDQLAQRIEKMSGILSRLMQSTPALKDAPTVAVESPRESTTSFSYSLTRDESGHVTESFSFKVQYKPAGESSFIETGAAPIPLQPETAPVKSALVSTQSVAGQEIDSVKGVLDDVKIAAEPLTFEEHVAKLIEYYRIATADDAPDSDELEVEEGAPVGVGGHGRDDAPETGGDIINIDADHVSRIYSGGGDDTFAINASTVRRVSSGEGDDTISINADNVARIRSGAGDDTVNIDADKVRRIHTGAGDDVLNINADKVSRINTGEGDDTLNITADTITRINTGEGDDVLNLTADTIKRVNAGAGDDTITIDANDAAIAFGKGGGEDVINITSVGALAIQIDSALATSSDDYEIVTDGNSVKLVFSSGESLTINNVDNADMISVRIGGENIDLHFSEAPVELDMSA